MKIRIGICDDSDHDRHYLKSIIKNYFKGREIEPEIVEYGSGEEFFRKPDVEILFLDIEMNALDGIMVKLNYKNFRQRQGLCLPPVIMI